MDKKTSKLALGTAQFGLDYGINNKRGKIPKDEVFLILDQAFSSGIDLLDTAYVYGESQKIIGEYFRSNDKKRFKVVTKVSTTVVDEVEKQVEDSLDMLGLNKIYGILLHNFKDFKNNSSIYRVLKNLKERGKVEKIGFSLYFTDELEYLLSNNIRFDLIQVPYNVFDQRFSDYFKILKEKNIEIHVRSIFLQGIFFRNVNQLSPYFEPLREKLERLNLFAKRKGSTILGVCLNFALLNENVDRVVVGVDGIENLREIIDALKKLNVDKEMEAELKEFRENNEDMILPFRWKLEEASV